VLGGGVGIGVDAEAELEQDDARSTVVHNTFSCVPQKPSLGFHQPES
jgi:hypothetical protein